MLQKAGNALIGAGANLDDWLAENGEAAANYMKAEAKRCAEIGTACIAPNDAMTSVMSVLYGEGKGGADKTTAQLDRAGSLATLMLLADLNPSGGGAKKAGAEIAEEIAEQVGKHTDEVAEAVGKGQKHHICTDKNCVSTASGGPWTPRFQEIFDGANMSLQDDANKVLVLGHRGPHPQEYHEEVYSRLSDAVQGLPLSTPAYEQALRQELGRIKVEIEKPGSRLNRLVTGGGR